MNKEKIIKMVNCLYNDVYDSKSAIGKKALLEIKKYINNLERKINNDKGINN